MFREDVHSKHFHTIISNLKYQDIDVEHILLKAGIHTKVLKSNHWIPYPQWESFCQQCAVQTNDPSFGLQAARWIVEAADGLFFYLAKYSSNATQILDTFANRTIGTEYPFKLRIEKDGEQVMLYDCLLETMQPSRTIVDFTFGYWSEFGRRIALSKEDYLSVVQFSYPEPDNAEVYREFFSAAVEFNSSHNRVIIANRVLEYIPEMAGPALHALLMGVPSNTSLAVEEIVPFYVQISTIIEKALPGPIPTVELMSKQFHMSPRTFHRKIKSEGSSYKQLVDDIRKQLAVSYLSIGAFKINEIATRLGFSGTSAFYKAFKRWYGRPPSDF